MTDPSPSQPEIGGSTATRNQRKVLLGRVVSANRSKTITVEVSRISMHPRYHKIIQKRKRFHAHDETDKARLGDMVEISSTRPISKTKRWRLVRIVAEAPSS